MANRMYPKGKSAIQRADVDLESDDIRVILVDLADYTYSTAHDFLDDVPAGARVATSGALGSKTVGSVAEGVFDAADVVFSSVSGDQAEAIIIYKHTGTESTSQLIAFLDTGVTGLPVLPNGENINLAWSASGIFQFTDV